MTIDLNAMRLNAERALALANAAKDGPWSVGEGYEQDDPGLYVKGPHLVVGDASQDWITSREDAEFIADARTRVPVLACDALALIAEVERLTVATNFLHEALAHVRDLRDRMSSLYDEKRAALVRVHEALGLPPLANPRAPIDADEMVARAATMRAVALAVEAHVVTDASGSEDLEDTATGRAILAAHRALQ